MSVFLVQATVAGGLDLAAVVGATFPSQLPRSTGFRLTSEKERLRRAVAEVQRDREVLRKAAIQLQVDRQSFREIQVLVPSPPLLCASGWCVAFYEPSVFVA